MCLESESLSVCFLSHFDRTQHTQVLSRRRRCSPSFTITAIVLSITSGFSVQSVHCIVTGTVFCTRVQVIVNSVLVSQSAGPNIGSSVSHQTKSSECLDPDSAADYFPESEHLVLETVLIAVNLVPTETETLTGAYPEQEAHAGPPGIYAASCISWKLSRDWSASGGLHAACCRLHATVVSIWDQSHWVSG